MQGHELLRDLAAATNAKRCLIVTSEDTGNPFLANLRIARFETLVSLQYGDLAQDGSASRYRPIGQVAREARRLGQFDVAFLDPFHTYRSSLAALRRIGRSTRRHGWMVVHDCYPPYDYSSDTFRPGPWCGSTYAAFRDVAMPSDRAWFVVDDDYGLGVLGPLKTGHLIRHVLPAELARRWARADIDGKRDLLRDHGPQLMRLVEPARVGGLLASVMAGTAVELAGAGG
ncbi:MAG: hypothetical protein HZA58_01155 [Acidimicrobiia bacterium]|nr:hypothetical protein [Acidimicrobiia bacterium]